MIWKLIVYLCDAAINVSVCKVKDHDINTHHAIKKGGRVVEFEFLWREAPWCNSHTQDVHW